MRPERPRWTGRSVKRKGGQGRSVIIPVPSVFAGHLDGSAVVLFVIISVGTPQGDEISYELPGLAVPAAIGRRSLYSGELTILAGRLIRSEVFRCNFIVTYNL